jgi:RES domain/HEPN/RES N-terminal domain 1
MIGLRRIDSLSGIERYMTEDVDTEELKLRLICCDCVGEQFLSDQIEAEGIDGTCHYCSGEGKTFTLEQMAERIATAFEQHYERTSDEPTGFERAMMNDKESPYDWSRHGDPVSDVIQEAAEIDVAPANDIHQILQEEYANDPMDAISGESEFDDESHYEPKKHDGSAWEREWREFERSLKTESRYFNEEARAHLRQIFDGIATMRTQAGASVIIEAGPEPDSAFQGFYRARSFESWSALEPALTRPDLHLGPPPAKFAQSGRMNARGIAVFYGADEAATALAEVRPPVGANVVVGQFKLTRRVRLLDLKAFAGILERGSTFDPTFARRKERAIFLEGLVRRMTMPVMPSDEALEYLPTQAIADFLASQVEPELDGILFPSVQVAGEKVNVVLFHKAARVAEVTYPKGTQLTVHTGMFNGEEWEPDLTVYEEVPPPPAEASPPEANSDDLDFGGLPPVEWEPLSERDLREVTLEVELSLLEVRQVKGVLFNTFDERVERQRIEARTHDGTRDNE